MDETKIERLLSSDERPIDEHAGLARFHATVEGRRIAPYRPAGRARWLQGLAAAAAVAVLFAGLAATGVAQTLFTVFQPKQVVPVTVASADLAGLPDLRDYGTLTITTQPAYRQAPTLAAASAETGIAALRPGTLPAGTPADPRLYTVTRGEGRFSFDQAKLQAAAGQVGRTPPPLPPAIASSTLHVTGGPAIVQAYGGSFHPDGQPDQMPTLLVAQAVAPVVRSDGATVDELRAYLLAQPGLSPQLAAQIRAIGDPSTTLLVPIPLDLASGKSVTVRGARGVFVGDSTGLGSAVVWVADGLVHLVGGTLGESELLAVANSLR